MKMMPHLKIKQSLCKITSSHFKIALIFIVTFLTVPSFAAKPTPKVQVPPCFTGQKRFFYPSANEPLWTGCKDDQGLYQGLLIQFTNQLEIIRIASVKDSKRDGREIRAGARGSLEERSFENGHLSGRSFIFKTDTLLGRLLPKPMTAKDWEVFSKPALVADSVSYLGLWLKAPPASVITFQSGRLVRLQFDKTDYQFEISRDGRMLAKNHPEMKNLFFTDPEALWILNADDLKKTINLGWGSCQKYSGPAGRYARQFDHLLYKRESSEKKHLAALKEMQDRFFKFCIPEDIVPHLGVLECPPQVPAPRPNRTCLLPISDQLHLPYQPKYYKNEFTLGMAPEDFVAALNKNGLLDFQMNTEKIEATLHLGKQQDVKLRKSGSGIVFKALAYDDKGNVLPEKEKGIGTDWTSWHQIPGN